MHCHGLALNHTNPVPVYQLCVGPSIKWPWLYEMPSPYDPITELSLSWDCCKTWFGVKRAGIVQPSQPLPRQIRCQLALCCTLVQVPPSENKYSGHDCGWARSHTKQKGGRKPPGLPALILLPGKPEDSHNLLQKSSINTWEARGYWEISQAPFPAGQQMCSVLWDFSQWHAPVDLV